MTLNELVTHLRAAGIEHSVSPYGHTLNYTISQLIITQTSPQLRFTVLFTEGQGYSDYDWLSYPAAALQVLLTLDLPITVSA